MDQKGTSSTSGEYLINIRKRIEDLEKRIEDLEKKYINANGKVEDLKKGLKRTSNEDIEASLKKRKL
jgi:chaperonin cofactor prefoldin